MFISKKLPTNNHKMAPCAFAINLIYNGTFFFYLTGKLPIKCVDISDLLACTDPFNFINIF